MQNNAETDWMNRLSQDDRPSFDGVRETAKNAKEEGNRIVLEVYDPYTGQTHITQARINSVDETRVIAGAGQTRLFVLPDQTAGHLDTQGGTDRMPDLVVEVL